jgi:hypothetical protein
MSMKDRAKAIREHGAAERGNYEPKQGSLQLRLYNFWLSKQSAPPKVENFCHYWRVVLIWAPMWGVRTFVEKHLFNRYGAIGAVAAMLLILTLVGGTAFLGGLLIAVGMLYAVLSIVAGLIMCAEHEQVIPKDNLYHEIGRYRLLLPVSLLMYAGYRGIYSLWNKMSFSVRAAIKHYSLRALIAAVALAVLYLFAWLFFAHTQTGLIILAAVVAIVILGFGISFASDYFKLKEAERREALALERAKEREKLLAQFNDPNFDWDAYWAAKGAPEPAVKPTKSRALTKFITAIGDFINLAFQAVRVKKWKICPIVQIPTDN